MRKILRILKINILSLLALPILLLATASKMLAKAMEKIGLILGMGLVTLSMGLIFKAISNATGFLQWFLLIAAIVLVLVLVIVIVRYLGSYVVLVGKHLITFFNTIYKYTHMGYLKLFETCQQDFNLLDAKDNQKGYYAACLFYSILLGFNKVIVGFVSIALYLAIGASLVLVVGFLLSLNSQISKALGIGLFAFLAKLDTFTLVRSIIMFVTCAATLIVTLLSMGIEWYKWSKELKMSSEEYGEYIKQEQNARKEAEDNPTRNSQFFSGCDTLHKLEKRYKSLCKAYHPDAEGGDEESFKAMQEEYERIKAKM